MKFPFKGKSEIKAKEIHLDSCTLQDATTLLKRLLAKDEMKRPTSQEALGSHWFEGMPCGTVDQVEK